MSRAPLAAPLLFTDADGEAIALLREIRDELRRSNTIHGSHLPKPRKRRRISAVDRAKLELLYPALVEIVGDMLFTAREIVERAELPDAASQKLAMALQATCGPGESTARRLGALLARGEGLAIAAVTLEKIGDERDGAVWQLRAR